MLFNYVYEHELKIDLPIINPNDKYQSLETTAYDEINEIDETETDELLKKIN